MANHGNCLSCGALWRITDTQPSYFFSSASRPHQTYPSPAVILGLEEDIISCPLDQPRSIPSEGFTPSGGNMQSGDSRITAGDETSPPTPA